MSTIVVIMLCFVVIVMFTRRTVRIRKAKIAIIFFSRHIFVYLNKSTKREQNEMNLRRHRNKNTAHFRSHYSLICISCRQKMCLHCVCSCAFSVQVLCARRNHNAYIYLKLFYGIISDEPYSHAFSYPFFCCRYMHIGHTFETYLQISSAPILHVFSVRQNQRKHVRIHYT